MRKGQAALEFLTTYGWAILIILVMIGTISFFGVTNPSTLSPSRCASSPEIRCIDYIIQDSTAMMMHRQSIGKTIYIQGVSCQYESNDIAGTAIINGIPTSINDPWSPRHALEMECDLSSFGVDMLKGEKIRMTYNLEYALTQGGFPHTVEGELYTEVQ